VDFRTGADGLIQPNLRNGRPQGLSVHIDPANRNIVNNGGPHRVLSVPDELRIVVDGATGHAVISPKQPMTPARFQELLNNIKLAN
jgi:hypothetical protein